MKLKKTMIALSSFASVAIPVTAAVSCGSKISRYDTENDKKLLIYSTFSATGVQNQGLSKIIETYNKYVDGLGEAGKKKGYMKIGDLVSVSGGYGAGMAKLRKDFNAKNKKGLANILIDYPGSAAILKSYNMELNLASQMGEERTKDLKDKFDKDFWSINDKIGGIKPGGAYAIPISLSSSASAINLPLFAYVVDQINKAKSDNGAWDGTSTTKPIDVSQGKIKELYDAGSLAKGDIAELKNKWGAFKNVIDLSSVGTIDDTIFDNWDQLIELMIAAQKAFGIPVDSSKQMHLLALDSPTNVVQMLSYAFADGDMSKFYINRDSKGRVNYEFLENKDSEAYKNFKNVVNLIKKGVDSGALWIGGKGAYGSALLINHQSMISIGSTAGASHWYTGSDGVAQVKDAPGISKIVAKPVDITINTSTQEYKSGSHTNKFELNGTATNKYNVELKTGYTFSNLEDDFTNNKFEYLISTEDQAAFEKKLTTKADFKEIGKSKDGKKVYYLVKVSSVQVLSGDQTVQESEVEGIFAPNKLKDKTKGGIYVQGPSLIPVHANGPEDKATALFVEWFVNGDNKYNFRDGAKNKHISNTPQPPLSYWLEKANYIAPLKDTFKAGSDSEKAIQAGLGNKFAKKYWRGVDIIWRMFHKADNDTNLSPIISPVDSFTSIARNEVTDIGIKDIYTDAHTKKSDSPSFEDTYELLKKLAKANNVI